MEEVLLCENIFKNDEMALLVGFHAVLAFYKIFSLEYRELDVSVSLLKHYNFTRKSLLISKQNYRFRRPKLLFFSVTGWQACKCNVDLPEFPLGKFCNLIVKMTILVPSN